METDPRLLLLSPEDNVFVIRGTLNAGEDIVVSGQTVRVAAQIGLGHKIARQDISKGTKILKYGVPIGLATQDIRPGDHVHLDNLKSAYTPTHSLEDARAEYEARDP